MKINKWFLVKDFFSHLEPGTFVTRKMYMDIMKPLIGEGLADAYRCYLQRVGYLYDGEIIRNRGVYFMSKQIPKDITLSKVILQAYGKK